MGWRFFLVFFWAVEQESLLALIQDDGQNWKL
jgi:hypothetical protein